MDNKTGARQEPLSLTLTKEMSDLEFTRGQAGGGGRSGREWWEWVGGGH